jgi:hypothetical protein
MKKSFPILFPFSFSILSFQYSFYYLPGSSHTLSYIFSSAQLAAARPKRAFDPSIQFSLVIFNLQMSAVAFGLSDRRATLQCVVCHQHRGVTSPPPPLPLQK